jgi:hypothetical protein
MGEHLSQHHFEFWPCTCAAHGAFETELQSHFFELFAVLVLAVVHGVDEFMQTLARRLTSHFANWPQVIADPLNAP